MNPADTSPELILAETEQLQNPILTKQPLVLSWHSLEVAEQNSTASTVKRSESYHYADTAIKKGPLVTLPVIQTKAVHNATRRFITLARWEGVVTDVLGTYFIAEVVDLDNEERAIAEFDKDELSSSDLAFCEPGNLFYWSVGYDVKENGQRSRSSVIRFRRLGFTLGPV